MALTIFILGVINMQEISIHELSLKVIDALQNLGMQPQTAWNQYGKSHVQIEHFFETRGQVFFNRGTMDDFVRHIQRRLEIGEIQCRHYNQLKLAAERVVELRDTGKLEWSFRGRVSKFKLNPHYDRLLENFLQAEKDLHPNTRGDVVWIAKKYFAWLIENGHDDIHDTGVEEIQRFMIYCSKHLTSSSVHNVKLYMKRLCGYLASTGLTVSDYKGLLSFPVCRESRLFPAIPQSEIALMLEMIDRHVPKGKRDYAIILLGVVVGLRAEDIARLKLTDIDWRRGEIKIVQKKNTRSLSLPLTTDVGEAIRDYILNGRQETTSDAVFLRHRFPYQAFSNGVAVGEIYEYYRKRSGLPRIAFDGKGFHALRRACGRDMIVAGVPVTTVAQVLGDGDVNSVKKYISLDSEHLKECALNFTGIEPKEGAVL